jgi:hypothetical protein
MNLVTKKFSVIRIKKEGSGLSKVTNVGYSIGRKELKRKILI